MDALKEEYRQEKELYLRMHKAIVDFNRHRKSNPHANVSHILSAYPPKELSKKVMEQFEKVKKIEYNMKVKREKAFLKTALLILVSTLLLGLGLAL